MYIRDNCPKCKKLVEIQLLSTTNEWKYYAACCDIRFNAKGEILTLGFDYEGDQ